MHAETQGLDSQRARSRVIGRELRRMFDDVVEEPVPPEIVELIKNLEAQTGHSDPEAS